MSLPPRVAASADRFYPPKVPHRTTRSSSCEARSAGHILVYFVPGYGAETSRGKRRLNWVWYFGVGEAVLPRMLVDRDGPQYHASLPFGGTPDSAIRDLRDLARREVHPMLVALVAATALSRRRRTCRHCPIAEPSAMIKISCHSGYCFPPETHPARDLWLYIRFTLSFRDSPEDLLAGTRDYGFLRDRPALGEPFRAQVRRGPA